jgi:DNA invertase Pin-like site-specific DNA recombinase
MDVGVDTSTAAGQLVANVMASVAERERRVIGERTAAALRVKREQGVVLGRPREMSERAVERIHELQRVGMNNSDIARQLNAENLPTATGRGRWHPPGVARALTWARA